MQIYIFDHFMNNLKTVLTESDVITATETKQINTAGEVNIELPFKKFNIIETDMILVHTGVGNRYRVYRVISRVLDNEILYIKANEYAYHLLRCDGIIHDKRPKDMPVKELLANVILNASDEGVAGWEVGYVDSDLPNFSGNFYREDRLSCLSKIKDKCKCEFEFIFTINNNKIDKRIIEAYNQVGRDTGKRFEYGDNLLSIVAETDASEVYTRAYGFGAGVGTGEGYGRKLDMSGFEWKEDEGKPINKPKDWDFVVDSRGSNYHDMKLDNETDPSTVFEFSDIKVEDENNTEELMNAKNDLIWATWNALQEVNRPKVQFKANLSLAGELKLGDRVQIVRSDIDVRYTARVFKEERDLANPALSTVELGDKVAFTTGDMIDKVTNQITNVNNQIQDIETNITFIENNTGNTIFYGKDMPIANKKGDTWFEEIDVVGGKQYKIHIWDGEKWVVSYSPEKTNEMLERIEQAEKDTQEAIEKAQEATDKADKLIIEFEDDVNKINQDIANLDKNIQDNNTKVDNAVNEFENNKTEVNSKLEELEGTIVNKVSKDEFNSTTANLGNQISAVVEKTTDNEKKIADLTVTADGIQTSVKDLKEETESKITQLDNAIQSKVSNDEFESTKNQFADGLSNVVKKVDNFKVGATNLINNSDNIGKMRTYPEEHSSVEVDGWQKFDIEDVRSNQEISTYDERWIVLNKDVNYIQQIRIKTDGTLKSMQFSFLKRWEHRRVDAKLNKVADNEWIAYAEFIGDNTENKMIDVQNFDVDGGTYISFKQAQLEVATIPSAWSPSPNDFPNGKQFSEVIQTVDSIQASVVDLENETQSQITQLDNSITQVVKDTTENKEKITSLTQTVDGIQIKAEDFEKETESKFTVLDEVIKSSVSQLGVSYPNSEFDDTNLANYYDVNSGLTQIAKDEQGSYLWIKDETSNSGKWPKLNFKADNIRTYYSNAVTVEIEYTLNIQNDANAYVQIVNKDSNDNVVEELPLKLPTTSSKKIEKTVLWFNRKQAKTQFQIGWNMGVNSKIDLRIYNIKFDVVDDNGFNLDFKDPKIDRYWHSWDKTSIVKRELDNNVLILRAMPSIGKSIAMLKDFIEVNNKEKLQLNFKSKVDYNWISNRRCQVFLHEYDEKKNEISNKNTYVKYDKSSTWYNNSFEYSLLENTKYIKVEFVHFYEEDSATMYIDSVYLINGKETVNSSISQLANNINLKVDKNDVVNQINISDEEILIQGNKIHLTGETIIDDAIITSAMIKDLTADKITAGTINGENINIVNIRAENITGVNANLVQTSWNAINGRIQIDGNSMRIYNYNNNEHISFSNGSLKFCNDTGYEICGLSRFSDGQVRLAINNGYHFYLMHRPDGWQEGMYSNIIGFDGRDGNMRVPQERALFIGNGADPFRFGTTKINGIGQYPTLRSPNTRCGIALGDDDIWFLIEGKAWNMSRILAKIGL